MERVNGEQGDKARGACSPQAKRKTGRCYTPVSSANTRICHQTHRFDRCVERCIDRLQQSAQQHHTAGPSGVSTHASTSTTTSGYA